jgi:hypothetical protein
MAFLGQEEAALLGSLYFNPGYTILRDSLTALMDNFLTDVDNAKTDEEERRALAHWRAVRAVVGHIDNLVNTHKDYADQVSLEKRLENDPKTEETLKNLLWQNQTFNFKRYLKNDIIESGETKNGN